MKRQGKGVVTGLLVIGMVMIGAGAASAEPLPGLQLGVVSPELNVDVLNGWFSGNTLGLINELNITINGPLVSGM